MSKIVSNPYQHFSSNNSQSFWLEVFSKEECNNICQYYNNKGLSQGVTGIEGQIDFSYRKSSISLDYINSDNKWIFDRLFSIIEISNDLYFQFKLTGFEFFQYTEYCPGEYYHYHTDTHFNVTDIKKDSFLTRKLSLTILLNDPEEFTGGEFQICVGNPENPLTHKISKGDAILFPSYLLHRIKPIEHGIRKSLVVWVLGPKWT